MVCNKCKVDKEATEFYNDRTHSNGKQSACKICKDIHSKAYYIKNKDKLDKKAKEWSRQNPGRWKKAQLERMKANPDLKLEYHLRDRFRITIDDYYTMIRKQNNQCAICKIYFTQMKAHIDHDHSTGFVRGLLCTRCNIGLGQFKDNFDTVLHALEYLMDGGTQSAIGIGRRHFTKN